LTRDQLFKNIKQKKSFLCIRLDTDIEKIPKHLFDNNDPVFEFNKQIIDATKDLCVAYKMNTAFYESLGVTGWQSLQKTFEYIPENIFTIADAKRADIGNTSAMYATAFFDRSKSGFSFDALTVSPYMGEDSVTPFVGFKDKWVILLALTSNSGAEDFQKSEIRNQKSEIRKLYGEVLSVSQKWGSPGNMMYVIGATQAELFSEIRKIVPEHFLLVPGVGAQGGSLAEVSKHGMNTQCGLLVNSSRQIIYASNAEDFAVKAGMEAKKTQQEMKKYLEEFMK
jgi:orotidine-5'-phosphate decarboxylase